MKLPQKEIQRSDTFTVKLLVDSELKPVVVVKRTELCERTPSLPAPAIDHKPKLLLYDRLTARKTIKYAAFLSRKKGFLKNTSAVVLLSSCHALGSKKRPPGQDGAQDSDNLCIILVS